MRSPGWLVPLLVLGGLGCGKPHTAASSSPTEASAAAPEAPKSASTPRIEANCQKLTDLMLQRMPAEGVDRPQMLEACITNSTEVRRTDPERFEKDAGCIEQATVLEDVMRCNEEPSSAEASPKVRAVCEKMIALVEKEPDVPDEARKELTDLEKCMVEGQREFDAEPEKFEQLADCVLGASVLANVLVCAVEAPKEGIPSVRSVCEKMAELADAEVDLPPEAKKELQDIEKCLVEGRREFDKDPERFEMMSGCILQSSDLSGVMKCAIEAEQSSE
jgi:hypothetical protein